jgi:8-oxo-dGTP diphosphatase
MEMKRWVVGFLFNGREVALVSKTHPEWQAGKLNGVGGKVEGEETPLEAMRREFLEEAGVAVEDWQEYAVLNVEPGTIHFFASHGNHPIESKTEEHVGWYRLDEVNHLPVIPNLKWLIPLALDPENARTVVEYRGP